MHNNLRVIFGYTALIAVLSISTAFAASKDVTKYSYETSIRSDVPSAQQVSIDLPVEVLQQINKKFSNIALVDDENNFVDFSYYVNNDLQSLAEASTVIEVSSQKEGEQQWLSDGDSFTRYKFDERIDQRNPSSVLLDLGGVTPLAQVTVYAPAKPPVRYIEILGGLEKDTPKKLVSKRLFTDSEITIPSQDDFRYLRLNFWGVGVQVDDIVPYQSNIGALYFEALPGTDYTLLYGGDTEYYASTDKKERLSNVSFGLKLGKSRLNTRLKTDADDDSVLNEEDNCPFVSNKNQSDQDGDRIGDTCDNVVDKKNYSQIDTDLDGVGDIADNCLILANPDQKDRDEDGLGDACDIANYKEKSNDSSDPVANRSIGKILWMIFGGVLLTCASMWAWFWNKKKNS